MIEITEFSKQYTVRSLQDSDAEMILQFCKENTLYYEYCGAEATMQQVLNDLHVAPEGVDMKDKYFVGFFDKNNLIAVLDYIDGFPQHDSGYIGFYMVNAHQQGKKIGSTIIQNVFLYLKHTGKTRIQLGIAEDNPQANHFWEKNGFIQLQKIPMDGWTAILAEKIL